MSNTIQRQKSGSRTLHPGRAGSIDTNASGIAESTISLGLYRFPEPPASIPTTPLRSEFGTNPPANLNSATEPSSSIYNPSNLSKSHPPLSKSSRSHYNEPPLSPHDWHEGASCIDVDAAEERLLPTSFITSLLKEGKNASHRTSQASEALSGISEMTYPPVVNRPPAPQYSPLPPSAWHHQVDPGLSARTSHMSGDSDTLHSAQGYPSTGNNASLSRGVRSPGVVSVLGYAPATLRSISSASQLSTPDTLPVSSGIGKYDQLDDDPKISTVHQKTFDLRDNPAPSVGSNQPFFRDSVHQSRRTSIHSEKSVAPSFASRISSLRRKLVWKRAKPLPPVPIIGHIPIAFENEHRMRDEAAPLPDLVNRAGQLQELLEKGRHPHHSLNSYSPNISPDTSHSIAYDPFSAQVGKTDYSEFRKSVGPTVMSNTTNQQRSMYTFSQQSTSGHPPPRAPRRRRFCIFLAVFLVAIAVGIGTGIGISKSKKHGAKFSCSGSLTGSTCSLDTTCVCTTSSSRCNGLSRSVINLLPAMNQAFLANFTLATAYNSLWMLQGNPSSNDCTSQALLLDIGSGLDPQTFPNRTQWTQAALLWNALQTQDPNSVSQIQSFVQKLSWKTLPQQDGPATSGGTSFTTTVSGFSFDFAAQKVTQPAASFVTLGQPTNAQISKVSTDAGATLDRIYSYAQASSLQRQTALKSYWTSVLQQKPNDLSIFKAALSVSPIMLPFNASSAPIRGLYPSASSSSTFPPPLACYPGLSTNLRQQLNTVETTVWGLKSSANPTQFDSSCYPTRPVYGVLDVLQLRLPYFESSTGLVQQAAVLSRDAIPRAVVYNGPLFSGFNSTPSVSTSQLDPRQYGTLNLADHVVLQYLSSMDINVAEEVVQFVLASTKNVPVPPLSSSPLYAALPNLPVLEVAIFGNVAPSDLTSTVSAFTTPSSALFFGSSDGSALRNWTIGTVSGPVVWTQNATSPLVVRDTSLSDGTTITQTWNAISAAISSNNPNFSLVNITTTFTNTKDFSP